MKKFQRTIVKVLEKYAHRDKYLKIGRNKNTNYLLSVENILQVQRNISIVAHRLQKEMLCEERFVVILCYCKRLYIVMFNENIFKRFKLSFLRCLHDIRVWY